MKAKLRAGETGNEKIMKNFSHETLMGRTGASASRSVRPVDPPGRGWERHSGIIPALVSLAFIVSLTVLFSGCTGGRASVDASTGQAASAQSSTDAQYFTVAANQMEHVQIARVETTNLPRTLRLTGTVAYNSFVTTPIISQVSGPVTRVLVYPGQTVHIGQPMLYVSSPDYAQLRDNYLKSRDAYNLAHKIYLRSQDLYAHHAIAAQDLEQASSAQNQAQADFEAAQQALKIVGITDPDQAVADSVSPEIPLRAPLSGEVVERLVAPGQVIQGGATQCFTISDMRTVWVLANVYQSDLAYVHLGDEVNIETNAYPEIFHGRISYLAPAMDPASRTLQVRIVTENPGQKLKKDMYVTVVVNAGAIPNALIVPNAAVLRNSENQPFVYAVAGPGEFAQRLIAIGETRGGMTQVLSGVEAGEQVAADGSLFLQFANSFQH